VVAAEGGRRHGARGACDRRRARLSRQQRPALPRDGCRDRRRAVGDDPRRPGFEWRLELRRRQSPAHRGHRRHGRARCGGRSWRCGSGAGRDLRVRIAERARSGYGEKRMSERNVGLIETVARMLAAALLGALALPAAAQLPAPNAAGISTGHVHLTVPDVEKHMEIWRLLGAEEKSLGRLRLLSFPGIYVLLTEGEPTAPSIETTANHVGFSVNDYDAYKAKLAEIGAAIFFENAEEGQILADLPDGVRIEILTDPEQEAPIAFHHYHLS